MVPHSIWREVNLTHACNFIFHLFFSIQLGRGRGHKGQRRHFTNPFEIQAQREREQRDRTWRAQRGEAEGDDEEGESGSGSGSEESEPDDTEQSKTAKGVQSLIEIENPNRAPKKPVKVNKLSKLILRS